MKELKHLTVILSDEHEGKARIINTDNESENVLVNLNYSNKTGDTRIEINLEVFKQKRQPLPVELFEREIQITEDQRIELYEDWGHTKAIMIKDVALRLKIERDDAIRIVDLACTYGLLTRGHNNTWKVISDVVQARWKEEAIRLRKGPEKEPETSAERLDRLRKQGLISKKEDEGEKGMIANEDKYDENELQVGDHAEIVPEEPLIGIDKPLSAIPMMKKRLKELEKIVQERGRDDISDRIKELSTLKVDIRNAEMQPSKYDSSQGIPTGKPGIVNMTGIYKQKEGASSRQAPQASRQVTQKLSKGNPAQVKKVRNLKKLTTR